MKVTKLFKIAFIGLFFSFSAQAWTTSQMAESAQLSTEQFETLYGHESVLGYQVQLVEGELLVDVLGRFEGESFSVTYDCHGHGDHMHCSDIYDQSFNSELEDALELELLHQGESSAFELVSERLKESLASYKVWGVVNSDIDHGGEEEVWVRFNFELDSTTRHFYVMCHEREHESAGDDHDHDDHKLECHVERSTGFEPSFPQL